MSRNLYIVPHDFTAAGDSALSYALNLGKKVRTEIQIIHVISDQTKLMAAKQKMDKIVQSIDSGVHLEVSGKIVVGNFFEDLGKIAKKEAAQLIIMGTHGLTGMQKLFGSNVIKVVTSSEVPFLVVQKGTKINEIKKIIVPIDMTKESLQIANLAGDISNIYGAEIHVVAEKETDEILSRKMANRMSIVRDQYTERNLNATFHLLEKRGSFYSKIMDYAKKNQGDFIAFAYHSESLFAVFDQFAANLVVNEQQLPCLIINSKSASKLYF